MIFDPLYLILIGPAMLLALWAQMRVKSAYAKASRIPVRSGLSGAEAAQAILRHHGLENAVSIEMVPGRLSDHYDPRNRVLRLSPEVFRGRSLASVGIAAHEVGHALQHATNYGPLALRNGIVPLAGIGSNAAFFLFFIGLILSMQPLILLAIILFGAVVFFQIVNLPVEFNASARAKMELPALGIIGADEEGTVRSVLSAAAMTYVAATLTAVLTLLYFIMRARN